MFDQATQPAKAYIYWQLKMLACNAKIYLTHNALYNNGSIAWQSDLKPYIFVFALFSLFFFFRNYLRKTIGETILSKFEKFLTSKCGWVRREEKYFDK